MYLLFHMVTKNIYFVFVCVCVYVLGVEFEKKQLWPMWRARGVTLMKVALEYLGSKCIVRSQLGPEEADFTPGLSN